ncbi:MAG: HAMP domain-containing sensor histidine kinase [Propionibacteriaceae bacterium]
MTEVAAPETSPPDRAPNPLGRGTLGRRLVLQVTALVAIAAILLSAATALTARTLLMNQVDRQLDNVTVRLRTGGPGPGPGLLQPYGQPIGTIFVATDTDKQALDSGILQDRGRRPNLSDAAIAQLAQVKVGSDAHSLTVAGLGHYRVVAYQATLVSETTRQPGVVVIGVPLTEVDNTLAQLIGTAAILSLLAIGAAALGARSLIERGLRPLNRVAATAQQVSQLELDRGEVALAVRVPPEDSDPTSEVGRVGQAINHMLNNVAGALTARQASETKVRQFVADASHELRNPLAAIRGYAELTRRSRDQMPSDAAYAMSRVESEAERMSRLVEDLLLLARLDSGPALDIKPTDLTEIVINAVSDARAAGPDHAWSLNLPDVPITALGDAHRLHQVVANLLANARTHTPPGTRVETGLSVSGGTAVLTVTDNGPGVPTEIQQRVFERFTRADTSRVRSVGAESGASTGLGLAIVAAVVEAHQGSVTVTSVPGRTEFSVWLPLAVQPELAPAS